MKARVASVLLLVVVAALAGAQSPNLFADRPGTYVIYADSRFDSFSYVGICYLGANQVALRSYTPETAAELTIQIELVVES